jgi:hypothetical protein
MKQSNCYLYSFNKKDCAADKWDYGLLKEIFDNHNIEQIKVNSLPITDRAFVVIPGPQNIGHEKHISKELKNISRLVLFITGDEEGVFDIDRIDHPNAEIWIQYPHKKHEQYNKFPIGVPQHLKNNLPNYKNKIYDAFFGGQITHQRRQQLAEVMPLIENALYKPTDGFAKGDKPIDYYNNLMSSRIAPCPAGAVAIDSFRLFEAIEMMSLPIADLRDSSGLEDDFYQRVFNKTVPFHKTKDWNELPAIVLNLLKDYPNNMHTVVCWWIKYKRDFGIKLMRQINAQK